MICAWSYTSDGGGGMVYPEGCRDVILRRQINAPPQLIISPFDRMPRWVSSAPGTVFEGYRLRPGAVISDDVTSFLATARTDTLTDIIYSSAVTSNGISDAIDALTEPGVTVTQACRHLGMPLRRIERMMRRHGQPSPAVWQQLARARRSVLQIARTVDSFAEIAADSGFSDQAHLTRSLRRWFGTTPGALRSDPALQTRLCQPGLGTGEQSSIM